MKKILLFILISCIFILAFQVSPYARRIRPFPTTPSTCQENEIGYNMTSHALVICTNAGYVALATGSSGSFAPSNATYITQTANSTLTNEQVLASLATGILKNTTTTGVLSIGVAGTDYESPLTFSAPLSRAVNTISCPTCITDITEVLAVTDLTTYDGLSGTGTTAIGATFASLTSNDVLTWNGSNWINQAASGGSIGSGNINMTVANASSVGTTTSLLAKLTGAPSTVRNAETTDTENAIGICTSGCGTTGNATIAIAGQVDCQFDGSTTAGNYVVISATSAGKCHDNGSSFPNDKAAYGRVLTTNVGAGTYAMTLMTPDIAFQNAGNGKSKPGGSNTQVQYNDSGVFGGDSKFIWNKSTWTLTLGGAGGCCAGILELKEQAGRNMSLGWNGSAEVWNTNGLETWIFAGDIYMYAGSSQRWRFSSAGMFIPSGSDGGFDIGDSTHHVRNIYFTNLISNSNERMYSGSAPSISGNGTLNSGSKDSAGKTTSTTTGAASIVLTFGTAFNNAPACYANNETTANLARATSTTTQVTIAGTTVTSDVISYVCIGY